LAIVIRGMVIADGGNPISPRFLQPPRPKRRRTFGSVVIELCELHAAAGDAVDIRRANLRRTVTTQIAVAEIVGEDENYVGLLCFGDGGVNKK